MSSEKNNSCVSSASHYALYLGMFWVFKYLFVIGSDYSDLAKYMLNILAIGTPVVLYLLLCIYRDKRLDGKITYGQAILFTLCLFGFASLIEAVIIAIHIFVINPAFISNLQDEIYHIYEKMNFSAPMLAALKEGVALFGPLYYIFCTILGNVFLGLILSFIFGYFVSRQQPNQNQKSP